MRNSLLISITGLIALIIIVGGYNRLAMAHGNDDSFVTFIATILGIGIPAYVGMVKSGQAHSKSVEVAEKIDQVQTDVTDAKGVAESAAHAATQAEANTNGKLTAQFDSVRDLIKGVDDKLTQHLIDHQTEASK
jgi:hypothetical protein